MILELYEIFVEINGEKCSVKNDKEKHVKITYRNLTRERNKSSVKTVNRFGNLMELPRVFAFSLEKKKYSNY